MTDDLDLDRLPPEDVAVRAVDRLDLETKRELAKWVIRCGLGPVFTRQRDVDLSPDEIGALLAISFDGRDDQLHDDLYRQLTEWYRDEQPEILPDRCPHCGNEWYTVRVRWKGQGPTDHSTPVECDDCGLVIEPDEDAAQIGYVDEETSVEAGFSSAWGSGAVGDDADDPPPARGAVRCEQCGKWTDEHSIECQRCGKDRRGDDS